MLFCFISTEPKCKQVYTGGYSNIPGGPDWYWYINSTHSLPLQYSNFKANEPNNFQGTRQWLLLWRMPITSGSMFLPVPLFMATGMQLKVTVTSVSLDYRNHDIYKCKCTCLSRRCPLSSADCAIYTPGIEIYSYTGSSHPGRIQSIFCTSIANHYIWAFNCSTGNPSLLGGESKHGMRSVTDNSTHACPAVGIEPKTFWSWAQCSIYSTRNNVYYLLTTLLLYVANVPNRIL